MASESKETLSSAQVCTLVVVAKYPAPGKAKTRLAKSVGDKKAAEISEAMLCDVLQRLGTFATGLFLGVIDVHFFNFSI